VTREEEIAIYRLLALPGLGSQALGRVLGAWRKDRDLIERFWGRPAAEYRRCWGLTDQAARYLQEQHDPSESRGVAETAITRAHEREIELLTVMEPGYAELAETHGLPPLLFTRGNQDLLWSVGVAIPHSKDASEAALAWGGEVAKGLAEAGQALVCGHNRDGYQRVGAAAKRARAPLVIVLDRSLDGAPAAGAWAEPLASARLWDERFRPERELIVSPFRSGESWTPRHARGRDALIMKIAGVIVAGDVRPGGTIASECLRAIDSGRLVFRSCFCRADLPAPPVPQKGDEATAMIFKAIVSLSEANCQSLSPPLRLTAPPQPGWQERRWLATVTEFARALECLVGERGWVVQESADAHVGQGGSLEADEAELASHDPSLMPGLRRVRSAEGVLAVIHIPATLGLDTSGSVMPASPPAERTGPCGVGSAADGSSGGWMVAVGVSGFIAPALLLTPGEPLRDLAALRSYLRHCHVRVQAAISTARLSSNR
jgi:hypothetical protein